MSAAHLFPGIGVGGYRSYGSEIQILGPLDRINLIIGPNDTGKSNFLSLYHKHGTSIFQAIAGGAEWSTYSNADDPHRVDGEPDPVIHVLWALRRGIASGRYKQIMEDLLSQPCFTRGTDVSWLEFAGPTSGTTSLRFSDEYIENILAETSVDLWSQLSGELTSTKGGGRGEDTRRALDWLRAHALEPLPKLEYIPAHREIRPTTRPGGDDYWDLSGLGLVDHLDRLRNASYLERDLQQQYRDILLAMKLLLEVDECSYNVPRDSGGRQTVGLELIINGQQRPLTSFGTGYEHALLLVAATVVYPDRMFCIEEPEVHMHPRLQRRLGEFLRDHTSTQMLISSHSGHLIDVLRGNLIRTSMVEYRTILSRPLYGERIELLDELGYRASDLLQTNCVIWVEGPSDRVYITAWLEKFAGPDSFVEGIHYVIMFYGGALLARLSAVVSGDESEDRVPLSRIQQHFAIVADSDKSGPLAALKDRVARVSAELDGRSTTHLWITAGRTIENYVPNDVLDRAVRAVHPTVTKLERSDPEYGLPNAVKSDGSSIDIDKVSVAEEVTKQLSPDFLEALDLAVRIPELAAFISRSNEGWSG